MKIMNIYEYENFRTYLADRYEALKEQEPSTTCRTFAEKAEFSNPGYFNDVVKGKRKLSKAAIEKMITVFEMNEQESGYFRLLVAFGQTNDPQKKDSAYRKMMFRRSRSAFARLHPDLHRYYQDYRYPLVRTALIAFPLRENYDELGRFLSPPLPRHALEKIVRDLCDWGLVRRNDQGVHEVTDRFVEPPAQLMAQVQQLNLQWMHQASEALLRLPPKARHMSSMLVAVSPDTGKAIASKIEALRKEIWEMIQNDPEDARCMMQLNVQYFPRSKTREPK